MSKKFLYLFKEGHDAFGGDQTTMKNTLGGKGAGLAEMTHAGMPVPRLHTVTGDADTELRLGGYGFVHFGHLLGVIVQPLTGTGRGGL